MKQRTWPHRTDNPRFTALPFDGSSADDLAAKLVRHHRHQTDRSASTSNRHVSKPSSSSSRLRSTASRRALASSGSPKPVASRDFAALPYDVLARIAASFTQSNLRAASLVCRSWNEALRPLREAMLLLYWGKRFKHGRGGARANSEKALESFLKGAARGSTLAMVDAGLMYWEMGKKEAAVELYRKAAALGDPAGQCNLGIAYLQVEPSKPQEAIEWLQLASTTGHIRAQYQLALCLHRGCGLDSNLVEAAKWYLKAAEGGYVRAMYNVALCYSFGEGLHRNLRQARSWMKRAADRGHSKAQFEHGLRLFSEGELLKAVVYLELATRAGERAAAHLKNVILQQLSAPSRDRVMFLADNWRALPSSR
ncbi:hypothetical protein BT93_H1875 [Corymbia citriodora subsp. variegata]|nr:hypothetical protein BT93_H1875 [Corymbia citriodora subsp. variegata]KAF8016489.1 hypothetical protein BT93_H1875 [Corymbia citriodora subsp. variegata]